VLKVANFFPGPTSFQNVTQKDGENCALKLLAKECI